MLIRVTTTPLTKHVNAIPRVVRLQSALGGRGLTGPSAWAPAVPWSSVDNYVAGPPASLVTFNNGLYVALQNNRNVAPNTDPTKWQLLIAGISAGSTRIVTVTATNHTCQTGVDEVVLATGPCTITLPDPAGIVTRYTVKRIAGGIVGVAALAGALLEGQASISNIGNVGKSLDFIGDGTNYSII